MEEEISTGQTFRLTIVNEDPLCRSCNKTYSDNGDSSDDRCPTCADAAKRQTAKEKAADGD